MGSLSYFISWLVRAHPTIETFAELKREHILEFADSLTSTIGVRTKRPLTAGSKTTILGCLSHFFTSIWRWEWDDTPVIRCSSLGMFQRGCGMCRAIFLRQNSARVMPAIRLWIAHFSVPPCSLPAGAGARRDEIHRLPVDCLDAYPDGTPRLRIPVGGDGPVNG